MSSCFHYAFPCIIYQKTKNNQHSGAHGHVIVVSENICTEEKIKIPSTPMRMATS